MSDNVSFTDEGFLHPSSSIFIVSHTWNISLSGPKFRIKK